MCFASAALKVTKMTNSLFTKHAKENLARDSGAGTWLRARSAFNQSPRNVFVRLRTHFAIKTSSFITSHCLQRCACTRQRALCEKLCAARTLTAGWFTGRIKRSFYELNLVNELRTEIWSRGRLDLRLVRVPEVKRVRTLFVPLLTHFDQTPRRAEL